MERLTQQEEEVMLYFWKLGPSFIRDVLNQSGQQLLHRFIQGNGFILRTGP